MVVVVDDDIDDDDDDFVDKWVNFATVQHHSCRVGHDEFQIPSWDQRSFGSRMGNDPVPYDSASRKMFVFEVGYESE